MIYTALLMYIIGGLISTLIVMVFIEYNKHEACKQLNIDLKILIHYYQSFI